MTGAVRFDTRGGGIGWDAVFEHPRAVHAADQPDHVRHVLNLAHSAALDGHWVAVVVTYDAAPAFDPAMRTKGRITGLPLVWVAVYDRPVEHQTQRSEQPVAVGRLGLQLTPALTLDGFRTRVLATQEHIRAGDTYQMNLTFPLRGPAIQATDDLYESLLSAQEASWCAALDLGSFAVLSWSPELFFSRTGTRLVMQPMKGTAPRGRWLEEDQQRGDRLRTSAKDRAENVMIVDLLRNDAGRIALTGSVRTPELFEVRRYPTLWQMTSTVTASIPAATTLLDIFDALFPCGSVTGAPKIRTMELLANLETKPRGVYTGAIGLIRPGGDCTFNVAIRTLVIDRTRGTARLDVGSGITIDSDPDDEYAECLLKAVFATRPMPVAAPLSLFETMRLEHGVISRVERHLARMRRSAEFFGYPWHDEAIRAELERARGGHDSGCWRMRLTSTSQGRAEVSCVPHDDGPLRTWRVGFSSTPVDERSPLLFNKTTHREVYDAARRERPDLDDMLLWNQQGHVTESTIANLLIDVGATRVTPPLTSGLLPGIAREELLEQGAIVERVITKDDVRQASGIWLVNSLRGLVRAELVDSNG